MIAPRVRNVAFIVALFVLPFTAYLCFHVGRNVNRCTSLAHRHTREREEMREAIRRIRHQFETETPQRLSDVQKLLLGLPPRDCANRRDAFTARWDVPVGRGQERLTARIDVRVEGCKNDSRVISFDVDERVVDTMWLEGCPPRAPQ